MSLWLLPSLINTGCFANAQMISERLLDMNGSQTTPDILCKQGTLSLSLSPWWGEHSACNSACSCRSGLGCCVDLVVLNVKSLSMQPLYSLKVCLWPLLPVVNTSPKFLLVLGSPFVLCSSAILVQGWEGGRDEITPIKGRWVLFSLSVCVHGFVFACLYVCRYVCVRRCVDTCVCAAV